MNLFSGAISAAGSAINPYLLYIKLFLIAAVISALVGAGLYVKYVFNDRDAQIKKNGVIQTQLDVTVAEYEGFKLQQVRVAEMQSDIIAAVRKVKIQSNVYIEGVENEAIPTIPAGGSIPLIRTGMLSKTTAARAAVYSNDTSSGFRAKP